MWTFGIDDDPVSVSPSGHTTGDAQDLSLTETVINQ